jgi:lysophospholipase L1-like esterase
MNVTMRIHAGMHCALLRLGSIAIVAAGLACASDSGSFVGPLAAAGSGGAPLAGAGASAGIGASSGSGGNGGSAPSAGGAAGTASAAGASGAGAASAIGAAGMSAGGMSGSAGAAGVNAGEGGGAGRAGEPAAGTAGGAGASGDHEPCPATGEPCRILPLGDSITFGLGYAGGYRVELFRRAHADGKSITFTGSLSNGPSMVDGEPFPRRNEGHSGWKIDQVADLIPSPALQELPHIVLLMIGTNDVAQNDELANAPERLDALIDRLVTNVPDALIVVATIPPLSFGGNGIESYNAAIPARVEARAAAGEHVLLVDVFTGFPTSELGDGVHPNQRGYERIAGVWYEAIADVLH